MNNDKKKQSIEKRQTAAKETLLGWLKKMPVVQIACDRSGVGTTTYYRWREEDMEFRTKADRAMREGISFVCDMSEAQLFALALKEKHWQAIKFILEHNHPRYAKRIEVIARTPDEALTPEQETVLREALRYSFSGNAIPSEHYGNKSST
jgi:hypothetical protein